MLNEEAICIGSKIFEPGKHFVLVDGFLEKNGCMSRTFNVQGGEQCQLFAPLGYTINKYRTPAQRFIWCGRTGYYVDTETSGGSILYVNQVPVKVKVYEQDGERICPEFGTPVKGKCR